MNNYIVWQMYLGHIKSGKGKTSKKEIGSLKFSLKVFYSKETDWTV